MLDHHNIQKAPNNELLTHAAIVLVGWVVLGLGAYAFLDYHTFRHLRGAALVITDQFEDKTCFRYRLNDGEYISISFFCIKTEGLTAEDVIDKVEARKKEVESNTRRERAALKAEEEKREKIEKLLTQ